MNTAIHRQLEQMEPILSFQELTEGLELVILLKKALNMSFDRFLVGVESCDLSEADKSIIRKEIIFLALRHLSRANTIVLELYQANLTAFR